MSATESLARWIWFQILKGSRKNRNRATVGKLFQAIPESKRARVRRQIMRQERFARRIAVPTLKVMLTIAWCSLLLSLVVATHTYMEEHEMLKSPFAK